MLLLILFISLCSGYSSSSWFPPIWDDTCSYTRDDTYACLKKYVDVNPKDEEITKKEIDEAISKYLPTYLKPMFWFVNTQGVVNECDYDKNGVITPRDWMLSIKTCLPEKRSQCTVQWFCDNVEKK